MFYGLAAMPSSVTCVMADFIGIWVSVLSLMVSWKTTKRFFFFFFFISVFILLCDSVIW